MGHCSSDGVGGACGASSCPLLTAMDCAPSFPFGAPRFYYSKSEMIMLDKVEEEAYTTIGGSVGSQR